jgi:hypothetical protein
MDSARLTPARRRREQRVNACILANGLHVESFGPARAVRVVGQGVHVTAAALADISPADLQPVTGPQRSDFDWTK